MTGRPLLAGCLRDRSEWPPNDGNRPGGDSAAHAARGRVSRRPDTEPSDNDPERQHELLIGFATRFVSAYDVGRHTLTYVSYGQEPGLLRRTATGAVEKLRATGPILGGFPGATFEERTVLSRRATFSHSSPTA